LGQTVYLTDLASLPYQPYPPTRHREMANQRGKPRFNPRGGDRRGQGPISARPSSSLWYGLALLLVLGLTQMYYLMPAGRTLPYSEFKALVKSGQVAEVTVGDQLIRGTLKDGPEKQRQFAVTRVEDPKLTEELEARGVKYTGELANRWLPDLLGWVIPLLFFVGLWSFFFRRMGGAEGGVMSFARSRAKIYADDEVKVRFSDVAGVDEAEEELKEIVEFLKQPKKYTNLGGRIPKGVLLVGPPGTGKTLLARAVAGEAHVPFFSLSGSEFVEMFVGVGAARIRDLFQQAEAKAPCIVFIDELDALGKTRVQSPLGSHEEREQTLNQLLAEMDGFDSRKGVIIMAATNRPEVLDPALLRPGRFDRQVLVDKPDVKGREEILRIHAKGVKIAQDVDLKIVAARTAGFAGADLANLVNEAALLAARADKTSVGMKDFESAIDRLIAGLEKKRVMSTKEREIVAYHESGHAIVASTLPNLDPVHKISIVQRGFGALGYTMQLPLEDRYLMQRGDLESQLAVLLGGRTAEEIALGEISTGAQNDLQRATDIARAMVTEFGMSDAVGAINYDGNKRNRFLDLPLPAERGLYAEETAQLIDGEIKRILTDAHNKAREVLTANRDKLERVTRRLLEIEVMEGDELRRLLELPPAVASVEKVPLPPTDTPTAPPTPTLG
jgi:cell division protease FtsH